MSNKLHHATALAVLAVTILAAAGGIATRSAYADDPPVQITVKATDTGFDPNVITVEQGKTVQLTFVWANDGHPNDEHIITIPDYKLESDKISQSNKTSTVTFIATKTGTFFFKCEIECDTHDLLQQGQLKVVAGSSGASAALQKPTIALDPQAGVVIKGGTVSLAVTLQDKDGKAIPKADIAFFARREFLGVSGEVAIGVAQTGPSGLASIVYHPTTTDPEVLTAKYAGGGIYDSAEQAINLVGSQQFAPQAHPSPADLHGLKSNAHIALIVVIASVWAVFLLVLLSVVSLSRIRPGNGQA